MTRPQEERKPDAVLRLLMDAEQKARTLMDTALEVWMERVRDVVIEIDKRLEAVKKG